MLSRNSTPFLLIAKLYHTSKGVYHHLVRCSVNIQWTVPDVFIRAMSSSLSPQEPAQHPPQPTKTEGQQRVKRIETNASIIWPGPGRSFEIYSETDDYVQYYCFLHELCEEPDPTDNASSCAWWRQNCVGQKTKLKKHSIGSWRI